MSELATVALIVAGILHVPLAVCWLVIVWRNPHDRDGTTLIGVLSLVVMFCVVACYYMMWLAGATS